MSAEPYVTCPECGHVYPTPRDLVAAYNASVDALNARVPDGLPPAMHIHHADEIVYCPGCLHGF